MQSSNTHIQGGRPVPKAPQQVQQQQPQQVHHQQPQAAAILNQRNAPPPPPPMVLQAAAAKAAGTAGKPVSAGDVQVFTTFDVKQSLLCESLAVTS